MASVITTAMDWLQNRVLQGLSTRLGEQEKRLAAIHRRLNRMENSMSALTDWLADFRAQVNEQTNRISGQLADLQARLAAGDQAAVTEVSDALSPIIADLSAIGSGNPTTDPLPAPPPEVPTDDSGAVVDDSGAGGTI